MYEVTSFRERMVLRLLFLITLILSAGSNISDECIKEITDARRHILYTTAPKGATQ